jgi:7-keto-8-aminopelargonate synthetase-like enzyme
MDTPTETKSQVHHGTAGFPSSSGKSFNGYFSADKRWNFRKNDLIDARARRLFETTALACTHDAYPFQIPLEGRTGPRVWADGHSMLMLSSYDYLGLIGDPRIDAAAIEAIRKYGTGTGGARLLTGTTDQHIQMERDLAAYKGTEAAITFSSGYLANVAVLGALLGPADRVIMDSLCHRSQELQNGAQANRTLVISDGVFSMDGDVCHLPEILEVKKEFGFFLLVDESHASGVLGACGRGTDEHFGIATDEVDIWTGSLAKSIPSTGGFAAVSQELAIYLQHGASPFIFSAALSPAAVAAIREGLAILKEEPERVAKIKHNADFLRSGLCSLGYDTGLSETAVIPVILNDETTTGLFARRLRDHGILATPVLFPAVPQDSARLRLCVTAAHTQEDLEYALDVFEKMARN